MNKFWSDLVGQLQPYVPGEQPKVGTFIKLNSNESPYEPSPQVKQAMQAVLQQGMGLYPDAESTEVAATVAEYYGIQADQVFVSNGSDEALAHLFKGLFVHANKRILFPNITYSFYPVYAKLFQVEYEQIPLNSDFSINLQPYLEADPQQVSAIIFANPNAPTSLSLGLDQIEHLLQAQPDILIVVDEAYVDFGAETAVPLIARYPNLLVIQTLSKSRALAGLRVGFVLAQADLLQALIRVKNSFNSYPVDRVAQAGAIAAMRDETYFQQIRRQVIDSREYLRAQLQQLGFHVLDSKTNFLFIRHPRHDAATIAAALRERGLLVRHFKQENIVQFLRVTIGTRENCEILVKLLSELLSKGMIET